jgi:Restriction endonuclease
VVRCDSHGSMTFGTDSDDDPTKAEPTPAQWRLFEEEVAKVQAKLDPESTIQRDVRLKGVLSKHQRQVDVLVQGTVGGQSFAIAVECKRYAKRLGIGAVDEFAGKLLDLGVDRGVLYALNGLTEPAQERAAGSRVPRIGLGDLLTGDEHVVPDVRGLFTGYGDCPNENCWMGDILWTWWDASNTRLRAGSCDTCGTWAVECPSCGESDLVDSGACYSCEANIALIWDRKGSEVQGIEVEVGNAMSTYDATNLPAPPPRSRNHPDDGLVVEGDQTSD